MVEGLARPAGSHGGGPAVAAVLAGHSPPLFSLDNLQAPLGSDEAFGLVMLALVVAALWALSARDRFRSEDGDDV